MERSEMNLTALLVWRWNGEKIDAYFKLHNKHSGRKNNRRDTGKARQIWRAILAALTEAVGTALLYMACALMNAL